MATTSAPPKWFLPVVIVIAVVVFIGLGVYAYLSNKSPTNQQNGAACTTAKECASGYCDGDACADKPCVTQGLPCTDNSNCCTQSCGTNGLCAAGDTWVTVPGGYNISSSGAGQNTSDSPSACEATCTGDCIGYTYFDAKTCSTVKSMPSTPLYTDGATSYLKKKGGQTLVLPGTFIGSAQQPYSKKSVDECKKMCQSTQCAGFSYDLSNGDCWLATDLTLLSGETQDVNITSYIL
jgi:hypothetical protein